MPVKSAGPAKRRSGLNFLEVAATLAWVLILRWLFNATHYRDELRAHVSGKPGIIDGLWHSPALLHEGSLQILLFFWLWVPLVLFIAFPFWWIAKGKRGGQ